MALLGKFDQTAHDLDNSHPHADNALTNKLLLFMHEPPWRDTRRWISSGMDI